MCTVTIIPKGKEDFVLTSNRDEAPNRISLSPDFYTIENTRLLFPKDNLAGGTWIGVSEKKRVVCVLNGGFVLHQRKPKYRTSRGVVAKDLMVSDAIEATIEAYDFNGIEPFTIVIADWNETLKFLELVWDGEKKHFKALPLAPKIWSSSTLYSETMKQERLNWFNDFKSENKLNADALLTFHKTAGKGNEDFGVVMDRGFVKTTSITQVEKNHSNVSMQYESLENNVVNTKTFNSPQVVNE
ncbi:NRDE family protein [Tamlana sp. 2201CG12-4]|uniref:NRDE family protein n=1 Tax=Tamlana sp. 2201CG12-4 TaxID=3112582 RepID=UPI002DBB5A52|nr:NRDE family protein [Tamlana sp. 2201CG12-4]MEC3907134.1 NRDE family protein [Tamlana sp. 2201CG12-4]